MRLSREDLYERVWSTPMRTLAAEFGLSDVGLKKTCTRLRIPTPERGYWAKKAAGQRVRQVPLPKLPASVKPETMTADFTVAQRAAAQAASPPEPATGPVAEQRAFESRPENLLTVPDVLESPHRLVAATVVAMRTAKPDTQHVLRSRASVGVLDLSVTLGTVDRALRIFDVLIKALLARGHRVELRTDDRKTTTVVIIGEHRIGIAITEKIERSELPKPPNAPSYYGKEYAYTPTGRLAFAITTMYLRTRCTWSDGKRQRLEECLNDIIVGLAETAEAMREHDERIAAQRRAWEEEERRRQAAQRRAEEEAARRRALSASMKAWRKSTAIREYVGEMRAALDAAPNVDPTALLEWLAWAGGYADQIDPRKTLRVPHDTTPRQSWMPGYGTVPTDEDGGIW